MYKSTLTIIVLVILQKSTEGQIVNTVNGNPSNNTIISIETNHHCGENQVFNGQSCVQACPCGYNYDPISHKCSQKSETVASCPPGYRHDQQSHKCIRSRLIETERKSCPFGYTFNGVSCVLSCPTGYVLDGRTNTCHTSKSSNSGLCPSGQGWNGRKCLPLTLSLSCPDGYKMENGKCTKRHYGSMKCPENHLVNPNNPSQCISKQSLAPQCPPDYQFVNNRCEKSIKNSMTCPVGYIFNNGVCTKTESQQSICPPNFYLENNSCVKKSVATGECPFDTEKVGDTCVKRSQGILKCGYGYELENDKCVKYEKSVLHCSAPYTLINGKCVLSVKLE